MYKTCYKNKTKMSHNAESQIMQKMRNRIKKDEIMILKTEGKKNMIKNKTKQKLTAILIRVSQNMLNKPKCVEKQKKA